MNEELTAAGQGRVDRRRGRTRPREGGPQAGGGAVYGLGLLGALVYFASSAHTPREYALAVGKAIVWPAILVHLALRRLDA